MYSILRVNKLKNRQQIGAAVSHNLRLVDVPNADSSRTESNEYYGAKSYAVLMGKLENIFFEKNIKPRKDAVLACEVILTASPEFFKNIDKETEEEWVLANSAFATKEFGKENILQFVVHNDESTKHIHLIFTPITKKNTLSMKELYGGKAKLQALQTRYNEAMRKYGFDLNRGKEQSKAKHTTLKEFYTFVNKLKSLKDEQIKELSESLNRYDVENEIKTRIDNEMLLRKICKVPTPQRKAFKP